MKTIWLPAALGAALLLSGCHFQEGARGGPPPHHGRYAGIGVFDAGSMWSHADIGPKGKDSAAANLSDDEHVIVVVDSDTGEVRECGDHSGLCFAMNPWTAAIAGRQLPAKLDAHRDDLMKADLKESAPTARRR
jgi:hypothetical protein